MASPFFDNAANAVSAAPGTSSFVLASAISGARSIATTAVADSIFHYHAIEGANWEIGVGPYNHATGTLARNVKLSSNSNALVNFGAGVVVGLGMSADRVQPHIGAMGWGMWVPGASAAVVFNMPVAPTVDGTPALGALTANGTYRQRRKRIQITAAASASSVAGYKGATTNAGVTLSTTSRLGGFEVITRFGIGPTLASSPRFFAGVAAVPQLTTSEPTALANFAAFYRNSTGGNILFGCRGAAGTAEGVDTGIALVAEGWYEAHIWANPGSQRINGILTRIDTPQVFIRLDVGLTNPPAVDTLMAPMVQYGQTTTSTAFVFDFGSLYLRSEMF